MMDDAKERFLLLLTAVVMIFSPVECGLLSGPLARLLLLTTESNEFLPRIQTSLAQDVRKLSNNSRAGGVRNRDC